MLHEVVRVCASLYVEGWLAFLALCLVATLALSTEAFGAPRLPEPWRRHGAHLLLALGLAAGLKLAWDVLWLCDDAFISFRYARNFADGNGLVYNVGEWVEGYTNFLWTLLLGLLGKAGADIPLAGLFGNLAAYVVAIVAVAATVRRIAPGPHLIPFAALALACTRPFYTFASSGLETMPAALLVAAGMWASTFRRGPLLSSLALTGAILMRPDQILIYGAMGLALVGEDLVRGAGRPLLQRLRPQRYLAYAAPFLLLYLPYFLWRWNAYGDFYPNTWYAKSGGLTYYTQGGVYLLHFLVSTGAFLWFPLLLLALPGPPRHPTELRLRLFAGAALPLFAWYVAKVGGDFMEHRFLVPVLPIAAVALESSVRWQLATGGRRARLLACVAIPALAAALLPIRPIPPQQKRWYLADESTFYPVRQLVPLRTEDFYSTRGRLLAETFAAEGHFPRIAEGSIGLVGYISGLPIVDMMGLTNRNVAHKPLQRRGRPGHEKLATVEEAIAEGAVLGFDDWWGSRYRSFTKAEIAGGPPLYLLRWDPALVAVQKLKLPDPAAALQRLVVLGDRDELLADLHFLRTFLAEHPRREQLIARVERELRAVADFEPGMPVGGRGDGFRLEVGRPPVGATGRGWLASSAASTGRWEIDLGTLPARELRFALAGKQGGTLRAQLVVDGAVVLEAEPRGEGRLRPVSWDLAAWAGRSGTLLLVDDDPSAVLSIDGIHWSGGPRDVRRLLRRADRPDATLLARAEKVLPEDDPDLAAVLARVAIHWDLDRLPDGTKIEGTAFGSGPVPGALHNQPEIQGMQGSGLLNSYHGGDRSTGVIRLPELELTGAPIHLLVGGGRDCRRVYVGLEVDGRIVRRACGADEEKLRAHTFDTEPFAGSRGRLVIVDQAEGGWGHILVDAIVVERPLPGPPNVGSSAR